MLSKPGTEFGPCVDEDCGHTDCAATRADAAKACDICGKPIEYGVKFYYTNQGTGIEHALCTWRQADAERAARGESLR